MSDKFDLTPDERQQLRRLLQSDDWKIVEKIHSAAVESARSLLESCHERFELHQGTVAGLRQFNEILHQWAREPIDKTIAPYFRKPTSSAVFAGH